MVLKLHIRRDTLDKEYPCLHFCGVFFVPMIYWILVNELNTLTTPDNLFVSSFGQVRPSPLTIQFTYPAI
jgi:hypothetical protein